MKVKIKRIDTSLPLPQHETKGACCLDLSARERTLIPPHQLGLIPTNVIVKVPTGYMFIVAARSSTPRKKGLLIPHGFGIIDQDYNGPDDEIFFQVFNYTEKEVVIERGERVAQGCFVSIGKAELLEVEEIQNKKSRGGFGTTG